MRILLVKTSSLGDVIHNLPVLSDIARHRPAATVDWCVEENFAEIPRLHPAIGEIIPIAIRRWRKQLLRAQTWRELAEARQRLRAGHYDLVIDTQGLLKSALCARQTGAVLAGYDAASAREPLAARFYDQHHAVDRAQHAVTRNRLLAGAALGYNVDGLPDYGLAKFRSASPAPSQQIVLLTATSRDDKLWPEAHWIALGQQLSGQGLHCILPGGSARERERASRIAAAIPGAVAAPPSTLPDLTRLLGSAAGVIGVDTGLTHLAVAVNTPTIALYTATDPGLTGVFGAGYHINLGGKGLIPSVEAVCSALLAGLGQ